MNTSNREKTEERREDEEEDIRRRRKKKVGGALLMLGPTRGLTRPFVSEPNVWLVATRAACSRDRPVLGWDISLWWISRRIRYSRAGNELQ